MPFPGPQITRLLPQKCLYCFHTAYHKDGILVLGRDKKQKETYQELLGMVKDFKVSKDAKIRNRYNQVPHLTQDTNGKVTNSQQTPQTRAKRSAFSHIQSQQSWQLVTYGQGRCTERAEHS